MSIVSNELLHCAHGGLTDFSFICTVDGATLRASYSGESQRNANHSWPHRSLCFHMHVNPQLVHCSSSSTSPPSHCPCLFFQLLPTMHTAQWLVALELPQYTTALMANGFDDDSTICTLTDDDLIQCGVDNLGHRRKMLVSIKQTIQARDQNHEQTKTVDASSSSSSSCSCSCRPNVCGYITIALIVVGVVVGITLLVKGVTMSYAK